PSPPQPLGLLVNVRAPARNPFHLRNPLLVFSSSCCALRAASILNPEPLPEEAHRLSTIDNRKSETANRSGASACVWAADAIPPSRVRRDAISAELDQSIMRTAPRPHSSSTRAMKLRSGWTL